MHSNEAKSSRGVLPYQGDPSLGKRRRPSLPRRAFPGQHKEALLGQESLLDPHDRQEEETQQLNHICWDTLISTPPRKMQIYGQGPKSASGVVSGARVLHTRDLAVPLPDMGPRTNGKHLMKRMSLQCCSSEHAQPGMPYLRQRGPLGAM